MTLESILNRKTIRDFSNKTVETELLDQLLAAANRAPSGFNLQPWEFLVVNCEETKIKLQPIAMGQRQIVEAPLIIVFLANTHCHKEHYSQILKAGLSSNLYSKELAQRYQKYVKAHFLVGPFGVIGQLKGLATAFARLFKPLPRLLCSSKDIRVYVRAQTMLAAQNFMIAAKAVGLATNPMEGFDEHRLKKLLNIPSHYSIPVIVATGYAKTAEDAKLSYRIPVADRLHKNRYQRK